MEVLSHPIDRFCSQTGMKVIEDQMRLRVTEILPTLTYASLGFLRHCHNGKVKRAMI